MNCRSLTDTKILNNCNTKQPTPTTADGGAHFTSDPFSWQQSIRQQKFKRRRHQIRCHVRLEQVRRTSTRTISCHMAFGIQRVHKFDLLDSTQLNAWRRYLSSWLQLRNFDSGDCCTSSESECVFGGYYSLLSSSSSSSSVLRSWQMQRCIEKPNAILSSSCVFFLLFRCSCCVDRVAGSTISARK